MDYLKKNLDGLFIFCYTTKIKLLGVALGHCYSIDCLESSACIWKHEQR